jgi:hypothetical protein
MQYDIELNKQTAELIKERKLTFNLCLHCELGYLQEYSDAVFSESYCSRAHELIVLQSYADAAELYNAVTEAE